MKHFAKTNLPVVFTITEEEAAYALTVQPRAGADYLKFAWFVTDDLNEVPLSRWHRLISTYQREIQAGEREFVLLTEVQVQALYALIYDEFKLTAPPPLALLVYPD